MITPIIDEDTVVMLEISSIFLKFLVKRKAVEPGIINKAIDSIIPTALRFASLIKMVLNIITFF